MNHECKYEDQFNIMSEQISDIHGALMGTLDSPNDGLIPRVQKLEDWKSSTTTRIKNRMAWLYSIIGGIVVAISAKLLGKL